ncbi:MAG TPA: MMPL family transporter, partial [Candidatus Bathyarchaeia archaeon]|nr:MMPL family transporter [Candidatus Bathyarchaeia archaeon]
MIFAAWLVALVVSVPAILQVQQVIVYSETAFNPKDSESSVAQQIVNRDFNIQEGSSSLVVVTNSDVRGNSTRDFTLALNWTLRNDPSLSNIGNITTIYDIYYQLLLGFSSVAHYQLYQIQNATNQANLLEFGIPDTYAETWTSLVNNGGFQVSGAQVVAYNQMANATSWTIVSSQVPPAYAQLALGYQNLFYKSWNSTFNPQAHYNTYQLLSNYSPFQRAQNVTKGSPSLSTQPAYYNITSEYFQSLLASSQNKNLFLNTARTFNLYPSCSGCNAWNDPSAVRTFAISTFEQEANLTAEQENLVGPIYDLGPVPPQTRLADIAGQLLHTGNILSYPLQPTSAIYDQFVSTRNDTMLIIIDFKPQGGDPSSSTQQIRNDVKVASQISGQTPSAYVTGAPAFNYDIETQSQMDVERIDPVTIALILIIAGLFFGSILAPILPVSAIGLSVGISFGLVYAIGRSITSVHFLVLTLLPVTMFGAGSDYCIFLVSRYAEERKNGREKDEAIKRAITRAGASISTSGATVIIAFASLAVAGFGLLRSIGLAVTIGISVALIVCLTLVPASLSLFGDKLFWPRRLRMKSPDTTSNSYYRRAARFTAKHSKLIILIAVAVSLPATGAVLSSRTSHDLIGQIPNNVESRQ